MTKNIEVSGTISRAARLVAVLVAGLALTACGGDGGGLPGLPGLSACETNNTAEVSFRNTAGATGDTMHADIDQVNVTGNIADGATSGPYTVSSGSHAVRFHDTSSGAILCAERTDNYAQCSSTTWSCSG